VEKCLPVVEESQSSNLNPTDEGVNGPIELEEEPEEFTFTREHLDGQLHEAIGRTLQTMIERAAEAAVRNLLQDVSERTIALVEAARRISEEAAQEVDAKIRSVLDETVKSLQIELPKPSTPKRRRSGSRRSS
jgi:type IV secretory pathway VirB4 component